MAMKKTLTDRVARAVCGEHIGPADDCPFGTIADYLVSQGDTVKVRVAVVVDSEKRYFAAGWTDSCDMDARDAAYDLAYPDEIGDTHHVHFIEADIPLPRSPTPLTVPGTVVQGASDAHS